MAFLRARLDEDSAAADGLSFACRIPDRIPDFTAAGGPAAERFWGHFTAARAIREVEAKRGILAEHVPAGDPADYDDGDAPCSEDEHFWPCGTLRHLAGIYSEHPDFQPEWKP